MTSNVSNPNYRTTGVRYTPSSRLVQLEGQVQEVTGIMRDNIALELERGGNLGELENKSEILNEGSRQFVIRTQRLKRKFWWKNVKMWIILIIVVVVIITIIIVAVVFTTKKKT